MFDIFPVIKNKQTKENSCVQIKIITKSQTRVDGNQETDKTQRNQIFTLLKCATGTKISSFPSSNSSSGIS